MPRTSSHHTPLTTSSPNYRVLVFWIGIIATLAYRVIIVVGHYSKDWSDILWYLGTIGFVWYFGHRYHIEQKHDRIIIERKLLEKVDSGRKLSADDTAALHYLLGSLVSSKSRWNYIIIFLASGFALVYDLILRLLIIQ